MCLMLSSWSSSLPAKCGLKVNYVGESQACAPNKCYSSMVGSGKEYTTIIESIMVTYSMYNLWVKYIHAGTSRSLPDNWLLYHTPRTNGELCLKGSIPFKNVKMQNSWITILHLVAPMLFSRGKSRSCLCYEAGLATWKSKATVRAHGPRGAEKASGWPCFIWLVVIWFIALHICLGICTTEAYYQLKF